MAVKIDLGNVAGPGVAPGGEVGSILAKATTEEYATEWLAPEQARSHIGAASSDLVAQLETLIGQAQQAIVELQGADESTALAVQANAAAIAEHAMAIGTNTTDIATNAAAIVSANEAITANTEAIETNTTDIATANTDISALQDSVSYYVFSTRSVAIENVDTMGTGVGTTTADTQGTLPPNTVFSRVITFWVGGAAFQIAWNSAAAYLRHRWTGEAAWCAWRAI